MESTCAIVIGMAGSGKTTFISQLNHKNNMKINLDPAVYSLPYKPNIDIRKDIDYKKVMKDHGLGPNGAIMTSLNMYSLKFDTVLNEIDQNKEDNKLFIIDTPGQIEVFTWSASGQIITQTLTNTLPTCLIYVLDSAKCQNPVTFMSNMFVCSSILYKMKIPLILVLNKKDIADTNKIKEWIKDYEKYENSLDTSSGYINALSRSMCLALEEFYSDMNIVEVDSLTGNGFDQVYQALDIARLEFIKNKEENQDKKFEQDYKKDNTNQLSAEFVQGQKIQFK